MEKGLVFDIQAHSIHDGPGCRTLVFLSGCPLRCTWCSNPEGQLLRPRLLFRKSKCIHSKYRCISACTKDAIHINDNENTAPVFDHSICDQCSEMACTSACFNEALCVAGRFITADELMKTLHRDQEFWGDQGGVTLTGGEPLLQHEFISTILSRCRSSYMHTAIETSGFADTDILMKVLPLTDWMFIDLKHMDPEAHKKETGVDNDLILRNIETVASADWEGRLIIRIPLIPGYNDSVQNCENTAAFLKRVGLSEIQIIPFHRLGNSKYEQLGMEYKFADTLTPSKETVLSALLPGFIHVQMMMHHFK